MVSESIPTGSSAMARDAAEIWRRDGAEMVRARATLASLGVDSDGRLHDPLPSVRWTTGEGKGLSGSQQTRIEATSEMALAERSREGSTSSEGTSVHGKAGPCFLYSGPRGAGGAGGGGGAAGGAGAAGVAGAAGGAGGAGMLYPQGGAGGKPVTVASLRANGGGGGETYLHS